ncbi:MAG: DUF3466 family protein [Gammaproteobacteria bacterium]|nr:DUF3466 family protein [Gammaproteobacteria bacterium]
MTKEMSFRPTPGIRSLPAAMIALVGLLSGVEVAAQDYQLIDLGVDVSPTDISNQGTVVGSRKTDAGNVGVRWTAADGLQDIAGTTVANAVNEIDQITGNTLTGAFRLDGAVVEWDGYGGFGINESGEISGSKELVNPYRPSPLPLDPAVYRPNKWYNLNVATVYSRGTRQGVYADLYVLDDINDGGFAVGSRRRYGLVGSSSILTTPAFDAVSYLPIPYGGYAKAINNLEMIVGATGSSSTTGEYAHAYLYDYHADTLHDLGTLNGGLTSSAADINDSNQVVGTSWLVTQLTSLSDPTQYHAFLWEDGQMTDLNDRVAADSGWILTAATAINDAGDVVGTGLLNGQVHGFLLTAAGTPPPVTNEPPVAVAAADITVGRAPLSVNFTAAGSYDPEGDALSYAWDFGDGVGSSGEADPSYVYTEAGRYIAVLSVTDAQGLTSTAQVEVRVRRSRGNR